MNNKIYNRTVGDESNKHFNLKVFLIGISFIILGFTILVFTGYFIITASVHDYFKDENSRRFKFNNQSNYFEMVINYINAYSYQFNPPTLFVSLLMFFSSITMISYFKWISWNYFIRN